MATKYMFVMPTTGHNTDYLNLALRDGGVSLTMGLANGKQEMHIKPARVRFDDHQWHKVTVHRRIQEVRTTLPAKLITVDTVYMCVHYFLQFNFRYRPSPVSVG